VREREREKVKSHRIIEFVIWHPVGPQQWVAGYQQARAREDSKSTLFRKDILCEVPFSTASIAIDRSLSFEFRHYVAVSEGIPATILSSLTLCLLRVFFSPPK